MAQGITHLDILLVELIHMIEVVLSRKGDPG